MIIHVNSEMTAITGASFLPDNFIINNLVWFFIRIIC